MEALKHAAERMLQALGEQSDQARDATVERVSIDVRIGEQTEVVMLRLRSGQLQTTCTCGAPRCAHAQHALLLLVAPQSLGLPVAQELTRRSSSHLPRVVVDRSSQSEPRFPAVVPLDPRGGDRFTLPLDVRAPEGRSIPGQAVTQSLAEAIEDVVTAIVRTGLDAEQSASVTEMLSRVAREAGSPMPLGVQRWIGRVRDAIDQRDVSLIAHALAAASAVAEDLRSETPSDEARARLATWLGDTRGFGVDRVSDRLLLEVAREWLNGSERQLIERRYLIDLNSGEGFREERARRAQLASVGGCPRLIGVGFAEVERGCAPRRMHLLQYTTTPSIDRASWDLLAAWAQRDSQALAAAYRASLREFGALSEPFALILPRAIELAPSPAVLLDRGPALLLGVDDGSGLLKRFLEIAQAVPATTEPAQPVRFAWIAGRLFDRDGQLLLKPLAVGIAGPNGLRHERL